MLRIGRLLALIWFCVPVIAIQAAQPESPAAKSVEMTDAERQFAELLTGAVLEGAFSTDLAPAAVPKPEGYSILSASKIEGERWVIQAKMTYKTIEVPIPIPVQVYWAGDTPVLQVTDLAIPLLGEGFYARVLFYQGRYAGTWQHGKAGGQLWGKVTRSVASPAPTSEKSPTGSATDQK